MSVRWRFLFPFGSPAAVGLLAWVVEDRRGTRAGSPLSCYATRPTFRYDRDSGHGDCRSKEGPTGGLEYQRAAKPRFSAKILCNRLPGAERKRPTH